jgi:hypothetical protein
MRNAPHVPLDRCRSMSLKAQLEACHREYEANVEARVIDAARRSIQTLAETGLVAKAVKAGETAPPFRLRYGPGGFIDLSDLLGSWARRRQLFSGVIGAPVFSN